MIVVAGERMCSARTTIMERLSYTKIKPAFLIICEHFSLAR
jgi:hypothetical protein